MVVKVDSSWEGDKLLIKPKASIEGILDVTMVMIEIIAIRYFLHFIPSFGNQHIIIVGANMERN